MKRVKAKVMSVSVNVNTCFPVRLIYNGTGAVFRNPITPSHRTSRHDLKMNYYGKTTSYTRLHFAMCAVRTLRYSDPSVLTHALLLHSWWYQKKKKQQQWGSSV